MIYVCIPCHNEAETVGVMLWKIRQVFTEFPREYQLIVADDGSTDATAEVLEPYTNVLPLTVLRHGERRGYAATVEALLRHVVALTDRPKRDTAVLMHADFAHDASLLPDVVRRMDSGADLVVVEGRVVGEPSRSRRWVRRWAPLLLRRRVRVDGVGDTVTGYAAFRLITLRNALRDVSGPLLTLDGWAANAQLLGHTAREARQVESLAAVERHDLRSRGTRVVPWSQAKALWRAGAVLERVVLPPAPVQVRAAVERKVVAS